MLITSLKIPTIGDTSFAFYSPEEEDSTINF